MNGIAVGLLEPIRQAGGIFELRNPADNSVIDPGYSVDTSPSANPLSKLQNNIASVNAAVRPSPTAALINLAVIQVGLTAST